MPKFSYGDYDPNSLADVARQLIDVGGRIQAESSRMRSLQVEKITVRGEDSKKRAFDLLEVFEDAIPAAIQRALREKAEGVKPESEKLPGVRGLKESPTKKKKAAAEKGE